MSGIAIIIPGVSFADKNLGQVTITTESELTTLNIVGNRTIKGETYQFSATYNSGVPSSKKGVSWSVINGAAYASIDASTGTLKIEPGARASIVTIKAVSTYDSSISTTAELTLTYAQLDVLDLSEGIGFFTNSSDIDTYTNGGCIYIEGEMKHLAKFGTGSVGQFFVSGIAGVNYINYYTLGAIFSYSDKTNVGAGSKERYFFRKEQTDLVNSNVLFSSSGGIYIDGENVVSTKSTMQGGAAKIMSIGFVENIGIDLNAITSNAQLATAIASASMFPTSNERIIKIKKFIVFASTDYKTAGEVIANRRYADIDLHFDEDGIPYNAGSNANIKFIYASKV